MALRTELLTRPPTKTTTPSGGLDSLKGRLAVLLVGTLLFAIGLIYCLKGSLFLEGDNHIRLKSHPQSSFNKSKTVKNGSGPIKEYPVKNRTIKQYPACPIPQLEPYHESIRYIVDNVEIPPEFNCTGSYPLLFSSTLQSTIIPAKGPDYFRDEGYESCCYRAGGESAEPSDGHNTTSPPCFPVSLTTETKIRAGLEVIAIFCKRKGSQKKILVDVHAFVPLKSRKEENPSNETKEMKEKFNVVILGLDAMSRMNFMRMMPQSHSFLMNELEAVEMLGYNKVGENTRPNILAMVTGDTYGGGDVVWTEYAKQGYYTMASDDGDHSYWLFDYVGGGSRLKPTDYDFRPVSHSADDKFKTETCYGPRLGFQSLLDYMEKYVDTMSRNKKNFFEFTWVTWLTHTYIHPALLGDPHLLKSLRWLKESGHLNNTIFILLSDHGSRLHLIRTAIQGQLEERLPLLYFVVPESFKIKYVLAYKNLLSNADKLMTTFDLHESLKEILNLDRIENRKLLERKDELSRLGRNLPRRISLFLPIPEFRICRMAGIIMNYCSCSYLEVVANVSNPEINIVAKAKIAVAHINFLLGSGGNNTNTTCARLKLHNVSRAMRVGDDTDFFWSGYSINLETKPGGGKFEALVAKETGGGDWKVQGPITRTNRYGNQSHCVRNVTMKPYCYCLE